MNKSWEPWERYFVLMAFHLLWNNWPADSGHPHNDEIADLLTKLKKSIGEEE